MLWILFLALVLTGTASGEAISGRVTDPTGAPIPGIRLLLFAGNRPAGSTLSDADGGYHFGGLSPAHYALRVHQLGFQQNESQIELTAGADVDHDLVLDLELLEEHIVVTATRTESAVSTLGNSVTVITSEQIEDQKTTRLSEVLRAVPGLHLVQSGGIGSITSVFLRGGESDYTKVLLDGIPLNQPGGALDLSNFSLANVERIEIVRGPQSALYGSDAISGVIQIFTTQGSEPGPPQFDVFLEGGSFNTFAGGAALRGGMGKVSYSSAFQHLSTDNMEPNDFFHANSLSSRFDVETSGNSLLTLVGRFERGRSGVPGPTAFGQSDGEEFFRKRDFLLGASWTHRTSQSWEQKMSYSQSYVNQLSADPVASGSFLPTFEDRQGAFPVFDFPFSFLDATRRHTANYQSDFFVSTHMLSAGFEYEEQRGTIGDLRASRTNLGYYLQDQFMLGQRLAVTGGVRLEDNGSFGFFASPRLSLAHLLRSGGSNPFWGPTRAKFNFGLGIKEPTFVQSFSPNFFFRGNPDLEPERSRGLEVGIEQSLAADLIQAEVNFFHNHYKDQIAFQTVDFETFEGSFFNIEEAKAWGFENIVAILASERFRIAGGYTYLNSTLIETGSPFSPVFAQGAGLLRRPAHSGFMAVSWRSRQVTLSTHASFNGTRPDSDFLGLGLTEVDGYVRWDLSAAYRINSTVELYTNFYNLLNQDYFEVLGFPALRFHFRSGLRFHF